MARDDGYTMIELAVALAIVGVLMAFGVVSYGYMMQRAGDQAVQLDLLTAVKVQALHHLEHGTFTEDRAVLRGLEPNLRYSTDGAGGELVVVVEPGRADRDVCLFARSDSGTWFGVYHSLHAGDLFSRSAPVACVPIQVAGWSRATW